MKSRDHFSRETDKNNIKRHVDQEKMTERERDRERDRERKGKRERDRERERRERVSERQIE